MNGMIHSISDGVKDKNRIRNEKEKTRKEFHTQKGSYSAPELYSTHPHKTKKKDKE